uniref:Uncharacterized protein n=1 Tax=Anguilla anguilla TaxID=7936 RepID=A0A0E9RRJ1_ANGAN
MLKLFQLIFQISFLTPKLAELIFEVILLFLLINYILREGLTFRL